MLLSDEFRKNIDVLYNLNPIQETVSLNLHTKKYTTIPLRKISCFHNFLSWFIHLITFTLVPRNPNLDRVTRDILKKTKPFNIEIRLEGIEQKWLIKAIENLSAVIKNHGGSQREKVEKLLQTIRSVKSVGFLAPSNERTTCDTETEQASVQNENDNLLEEFEILLQMNASVHQIIPLLGKIPVMKLEELPINQLLLLAIEMRKNPLYNNLRETFLTVIQAIEKKGDEDFLLDQKDQVAILLPFFKREVQVILIGLLLRDGIFNVVNDIYTDIFIHEAKKLPLEIWEEASKCVPNFFWDIMLLPPAQCAAIVNGKMNDPAFINEFITRYFASDDVEAQKTCISYLKPEIFSTKSDFNPTVSTHITAILSLLDYFTDENKLKYLLAGPFISDYVDQMHPGHGYLTGIFDHFKIHPWKLFFLLGDDNFNHSALINWLQGDYSCFKDCIQHFTHFQWKEINKQIQLAFNLIKNNQFFEALEVYNVLPGVLQSLFIRFVNNAPIEELCQEIPNMHEGHFFIILSEGNCERDKFLAAFQHGLRNRLFSSKLIRRIELIHGVVMELEERFKEA